MSTNIPRAVREQLKQAEDIRQQMATDAATPAVAQDAKPDDTPAPQPETPVVQATQEAPTEVRSEAPAPQSDDWEHKYKVLQGMHGADVQRARELADQNRQLRDLIARMQEASAQQAKAPEQAPQAAKSYSFVSQDEINDYDAELLDVTARKAKEQYLPMIEALQEHIRTLEQTIGGRIQHVEQVATMSAKDAFFKKLDDTLPNWEQLNTDPGFLSWLDSPDDLSGVNRREMFNRAYQNLDTARVAKFFNTYAPQAAAASAPPNAMRPTVPMENLVSPAKAQASSAPAGKKQWSRQEISAFYENARRGTYKGKEAERLRLERDIFDAGREGRIQ